MRFRRIKGGGGRVRLRYVSHSGGYLRIPYQALGACLRPNTIVSDVGSVKGGIGVRMESQLPSSVHFVGAHPIAGKEKSGVAYAESLFRGARCIVTPTSVLTLER